MYKAPPQMRRRVRRKKRRRGDEPEYTPQINALSVAINRHLVNNNGKVEQNTVLMLQRTIGNQATQDILQRQESLTPEMLLAQAATQESARDLDDEMIQHMTNKTLKVLTFQPDKLNDWKYKLDELLTKRAQEFNREALLIFMVHKTLLEDKKLNFDKLPPDFFKILAPDLQKLFESMEEQLKEWQEKKSKAPEAWLSMVGQMTKDAMTGESNQKTAWIAELEKTYKDNKNLSIMDKAFVLVMLAILRGEALPPFYKDLDPRMVQLIEQLLEAIEEHKKYEEAGDIQSGQGDSQGNQGNNPLGRLFGRGKQN